MVRKQTAPSHSKSWHIPGVRFVKGDLISLCQLLRDHRTLGNSITLDVLLLRQTETAVSTDMLAWLWGLLTAARHLSGAGMRVM